MSPKRQYANDVSLFFGLGRGNTSNLAEQLKDRHPDLLEEFKFQFILTPSDVLSVLHYSEMHVTILFGTALFHKLKCLLKLTLNGDANLTATLVGYSTTIITFKTASVKNIFLSIINITYYITSGEKVIFLYYSLHYFHVTL